MSDRKRHAARTHKRDTTPVRRVQATYDSASTTVSNESYWQYTDSLSATEANKESVRRILRQRSRYEYDNNPYVKGIISTMAGDVIGKNGPQLALVGSTPNHVALAKDYKAWTKEIKYASKLRKSVEAKKKDGESWVLMVSKKTLKGPVKLYIQQFESEQVGSHYNSSTEVDGVYTDKFGEAAYYNLFDQHPGDGGTSLKGRKISADQLLQYAHMTRAGQLRGIPETTPVLPICVQLRAYLMAVLSSAETAANLAAVLQTTGNADDECDDVEPEVEFDISRNSIKVMPFGWQLNQLKAEQPTDTMPDAVKQYVNQIARAFNMPYNVAALNSADYNYASGRLDFQTYWKELDIEQGIVNETLNDPIFYAYAEEWMARKGIREMDLSHDWRYDAHPHVDPSKEADAESVKLDNMTTNIEEIASSQGKDWREIIKQRLAEEAFIKKERERLGLPAVGENDGTTNTPPEGDDDSSQQTDS